MAAPMPTGPASSSAVNETSTVPRIMGAAPNSCVRMNHLVPVRKPSPSCRQTGRLCTMSSSRMATMTPAAISEKQKVEILVKLQRTVMDDGLLLLELGELEVAVFLHQVLATVTEHEFHESLHVA